MFQRLQKTVVDQRRATVLENEGAQDVKDGNLQKAMSAYKEALQVVPQDAKVRYDLALYLKSCGIATRSVRSCYRRRPWTPRSPMCTTSLDS